MRAVLPRVGIGIWAAAALFGSPSLAADLGFNAAQAPPLFGAITWTGWYAGVNAGGHFSNDKLSTVTNDPSGFFAPGGPATIDAASPTTLNASGFSGGVQGGYNWQFGQNVVGIEGDFNLLAGTATRNLTGFPIINPFDVESNFDRPSYLATIRPRLGTVLFDPRALVYVTAGVAFGQIETNDTFGAAAGTNVSSVGGWTTLTGWTVGGGVEYAITNFWSVKGEYLYADLGSFSATALPFFGSSAFITYNHKYTENIARVGLNYKFGSPF
jgi:outer membrane immunogenic protein